MNLPTDSLYECRSLSLDKQRLGKPGASRAASQRRLYRSQYSVPSSVWPSWVHQSYDLQLLDQRARSTSLIRSMLQPNPVARLDPVGLSYWMAQKLPMECQYRLPLLDINNANQRFRALISLMEKSQKRLCCRECGTTLARRKDCFSVSKIGPPIGIDQEAIVIVNRTEGLVEASNNSPSSKDSTWFPGLVLCGLCLFSLESRFNFGCSFYFRYSWFIVECSKCRAAVGRIFTATGNPSALQPVKFWALRWSSCTLQMKMRKQESLEQDGVDEDCMVV